MAAILISLTILLPWIGAVAVWRIKDQPETRKHRLAVLFSVGTAIISLFLLTVTGRESVINIPFGNGLGRLSFSTDGLGIFLAVIANCVGSLAVVFSVEYMKGERDLGRYYGMILLFVGAMSGLVLTSYVFLIFFFWEITALCSYQLISFYNDDPKAVRGGLKALFITQFGGVGLLAGALVIYSQTGSFDINIFLTAAKAGKIAGPALSFIGFAMIIAAAAKSSQFPFFTWLPDAMEAPTPVSALIHAATMVNAGVYLLCRFSPAFESIPGWKELVLWIGIITIILASLMAIYADDLKRVLAYSTVSQLGFLFAAIGAGSVSASQFHLLSHSIFKALLFLCAGSIIHSVGTRDMRLMGGLFKKTPVVGTAFIIGAAALAGIPIFNGFWSKELILEMVHTHSSVLAYVLMVFAVILTAYYTLRCVWLVFFGETRSDLHVHQPGLWMKVPLFILSAGTLLSWLFFGKFSSLLAKTLPLHTIHTATTWQMVLTILKDPLTYLALLMVAIGFLVWIFKKPASENAFMPRFFKKISLDSFGFETINSKIVHNLQTLGDQSLELQTGILNWNIFGILVGLVLVLVILGIGG